MNSTNDRPTTSMGTPIDDQQARLHSTRSSTASMSNDETTPVAPTTGTKRPKEVSPCYVCGAKAHGYNFDQSRTIV